MTMQTDRRDALPSRRASRPNVSRRGKGRPTYRLYVIRLRNAAAHTRRMREANPDAVAGKPVVYVGMTKQTREARFAQHKAGGMLSSSIVRTFGKHLFPWAYRFTRTYRSKTKAEAAERALAERWRREGWFVWQH